MDGTGVVQSKLLSFTEARQAVEEYASQLTPSDPEVLSLLEALGLVLAFRSHLPTAEDRG